MTDETLDIPLCVFSDARERIRGLAIETPAVVFNDERASPTWLKLENLQPVGSFKLRCAANALLLRASSCPDGVYTASAGNFAQGLAFAGQALGVSVKTFVPQQAADSKLEALRRLGATILKIPYDQWWSMLTCPPNDTAFIHPVVDPDVIAGNGVIGLELLEQVPNLNRIFVPYGGGGLSIGIAAAIKAAGSDARVIACETEAGAPLRAALAAGHPVTVDFDPLSFITGMGGPAVLPQMWPYVQAFLAGSKTVSLKQTAEAVRLLVERHHLVAEGAGAAPVAVALTDKIAGNTACVISGGHLDCNHLISILKGEVPRIDPAATISA